MAAAPDHEEPTMREEEVLACAFGAWYERYHGVTGKSEVHRLPEEFVRFLLADGICLAADTKDGTASDSSLEDSPPAGGGDAASSSGSSSAEQEEASFPELEEQVSAAIERLGGAVLPKLNWSAPKDASWLYGSMRCTTAREVFTLLKASDFVAHDLCHSFDHCGTSRTRPDEFTLVLRRWRGLHLAGEFRCFVAEGSLLAISQRHAEQLYEHLGQQGEVDALHREIQAFFEEHLRGTFPVQRYAFDLYVASAPQRRVRLVDFSPWGPTTDACLFDWEDLAELTAAAASSPPLAACAPADFRVVREESDRRAKADKYSQVPLELAQLGAGEGVDDLLRKADDLLKKKGKE